MNKQSLREKYKALRAQLTEEELENLSLSIANQALTLPIWEHTYYHIFLPIAKQREVNTEYLLHILQGKDKEVVLSKSNFQTHEMTSLLLTDTTRIILGPFGIPEPEDGLEVPSSKIDVVFVPLLAFDLQGHRVGYGKGFYDRFLQTCKANVVKVGLSFFEAEALVEASPFDVALDYCVTPNKVYTLQASSE